MPENSRKDLEDKADAAIFTRKWNLEGLKQRLAQHEKMHHENILAQTLKITGGWPLLLDVLFERCKKQDDVRQFLPQMHDELKEASSALRKEFLAGVGILDNKIAHSLVMYLKDFQDGEAVPIDMLSPEYITGANGLTADECKNGIEYLFRMNCIDIQDDNVRLDPIIKAVVS